LVLQVSVGAALLLGRAEQNSAATWAQLNSPAPDTAGTLILLTDGSVMVQGHANTWMRLKPDAAGSYINGTWSSLAPMSTPRLYFATNMLTDGRVWLLGGEYSGNPLQQNWTNTGEVYDPVSNSWSPITHHPEPQFGDVPTMLISNTTLLAGSLFSRNTYLYDIPTDSWSSAIPKYYNDRSDEETWVKLPDGSVLTYDLFASISLGGAYAERFNLRTNSWTPISPSDGTAAGFIPQLSSPSVGHELGGALRVKDGRILVIGATGHTALYTPRTNTWSSGPDIMGVLSGGSALFGADDAPAAVTPGGEVILDADAGPTLGLFSPPTQVFSFDPDADSIGPVSPAIPDTNLSSRPAFVTRMLVLPTGQVLFSDSSNRLWVYTPDGQPDPGSRPSIDDITYEGASVFMLSGKRLNGQSSGSSYGDDVESDENYPIVRLTAAAANTVYYARTFNWSTTRIATGIQPATVDFTLPHDIPPGTYLVQAIGAGIASLPTVLNVTADQIP